MLMPKMLNISVFSSIEKNTDS